MTFQPAKTVWRDFVTDGVPASGPWKPHKSDVRDWGTWLEAQFQGRPYINVVADYGAKADVVSVTATVSITSGSAALTATGAAFTLADVGKSIFVPGAGASGAMLATTISAFTDATHVTLAANAGTTLTAVSKVVKYWTNQSTAFQNAINAAIAIKGTVFIPSGNYGFDGANAGVLNPGAGDIAFIGDGKSILTYFEGENASLRYLFRNDTAGTKGSLYFGPGICFQGTLDAYGRRAGNPLWLDYYSAVLLDGVEWKNIAAEAMDFHFCGSFICTNGQFQSIAADGIRVRDTSNCIITNNYLLRTGDDAIAAHTSDGNPIGTREGVIIANNHLVNAGTIKVLGGRVVHITGNRIELGNLSAIQVANASGQLEGNFPLRDIVIANNIILDMLTATGGAFGTTHSCIVLTAITATGQTSTHNTRPGRYDTTGAAWVFPWTYDEVDVDGPAGAGGVVVPPVFGVRISGNVMRRSRPAVANFSAYGVGTRLWQGVSTDLAVSDANLRPAFGFTSNSGSFTDMMITENIGECLGNFISFNTAAYDNQFERVVIARNVTRDILNRCVLLNGPTVTLDMIIEDNDFDGDTYRQNANSNINGTYAAQSVPRGVDIGSATGLKIRRNRFRNCCQAIAMNLPDRNIIEGNLLSCAPVAVGFSTSNKGIGQVELADGRFLYEIIDADPTSATYGVSNNTQQVAASAMPSSGTYVAGALVRNNTPSNGILGWERLTTGSAHVLNTDWKAVYFDVMTDPARGIGYAAGAGGTVTQATSKATGVTLNRPSGAITMNAAALAAGTVVSFVLTNSVITADDVLILNHISGGTPGSYSLNARCAAGSATIDVRNNTAGSLSEAIVVQFALVQGAIV